VNAAPDFAEPILGWRLWLVAETDGSLRLESLVYNQPWPVRRPLVATCLRGRRSEQAQLVHDGIPHPAPVASCHCGIYAASELDVLAPYLDGSYPGKAVAGRVFGVVSLWGSVLACDQGWRASLAYPALLYIPAGWSSSLERPDDVAHALASYGIPVRLLKASSATTALRRLRREAAGHRIHVRGAVMSAKPHRQRTAAGMDGRPTSVRLRAASQAGLAER
jgi:hypothetical protein